jgi:gliding motility associated protien GldN
LNYPLYYPTEVVQARKSFVQALVAAIQAGTIKAYDTDSDEFTAELSPEALRSRFEATDRTEIRQKMDGSGDTTVTIRGEFNWGEVKELLVKEDWFFDKHHSQMDVRIIGICPVRVYTKEIQTADEDEEIAAEVVKKQLFWIYYPEVRKVLANTPCFVGENEVTQLSFDDLFRKRRFSSYITAISNNQNNRQIHSYTRNGKEAMLESERLKQEIFNFESDLWEY